MGVSRTEGIRCGCVCVSTTEGGRCGWVCLGRRDEVWV